MIEKTTATAPEPQDPTPKPLTIETAGVPVPKANNDNTPEAVNDNDLTPLAGEQTYGEKKYNFVFDVLINFWINLAASAAFTYWVMHSKKPYKVLGKEFAPPSQQIEKLTQVIYKSAPMRVFGQTEQYNPAEPPNTLRARASINAANVFTLVMMGHPIMIGSIWLGAKIKTPFVKFFNRRHYGDEAMESPDLKARHLAIEGEERPTLLGAVIGRLGTIVATQVTAYTVGNTSNLINAVGKHVGIRFPGMDHVADKLGETAGRALESGLPNATGRLNAAATRKGYDWSTMQVQKFSNTHGIDFEQAKLQMGPYNHATQHLGKYLAQDVLYSTVTAVSIHPVLNTLKHYIPGLTYRPHIAKPELQEAKKLESELNIKPVALGDKAIPMGALDKQPGTRISQMHLHGAAFDTLNPQVSV